MAGENIYRLPTIGLLLAGDVETWPDIPERNAPCLCGSGKKFKRCCLPALEQAKVEYSKEAL